jgi:peptide/nickel transport system substrate-binding protein
MNTVSLRCRIGHRAGVALIASILGVSGVVAISSSSASGASGSSLTNVPYQAGGTPVSGGNLVYDTFSTFNNWTPWLPGSAGQVWLDQDVFDGIVDLSPTTGLPIPGVASSWTVSKSGLIYTFTIRPGIKFSNGNPVTTADLIYTLDEWSNPKINTYWTALGSMIKSATAVGTTQVRVVLSRVTPAFLDDLAVSGADVVPAALLASEGATAFGLNPVGTGPFTVSGFSPTGTSFTLEKNPNYWQPGKPYLNSVTVNSIPDDTTRVLAVESGSGDIADSVPFSQVKTVDAAQDTTVVSQHFGDLYAAMFNTTKGPLHNVLVRQALSYATPLSTIKKVAFDGLATTANSVDMQTEYWDSSIKQYPFDVAKAKSLLSQAGYKHGITLTINVNSGDTLTQQVVTILQSAWAKAGVKLLIRTLDGGTAFTNFSKLDYQIWLAPTSQWNTNISTPDEYAEFFAAPNLKTSLTSFPFNGFDNAQAAHLVAEATSTDNNQLRQKLFDEYQVIMHDQVPALAIAYAPQLFAVRSNVHNFVTTFEGFPLLGQVWLSSN